ncbi:hypothetical protein [Sorangium cellulosum]|uniref:hypothetical protein n=1 Tax=Sorangium cellulosum TaxID=56 RepID=UPI0012DB5858|nr:hypothetical protein [Sorangium cellulosum]
MRPCRVAVRDFPPTDVEALTPEVPVLAAVCRERGTGLLSPDQPVRAGVRIL